MPNHDGGHYFLTVLAPIRTDTEGDPETGASRSRRHLLAQKLALLPTGRQTAVSPPDAPPSPFAGNTINHLARFVILDGPAFNGRLSADTLVSTVRKVNPLAPQPVDAFRTPYLLFAADLDAPGDGEAALRAYTEQLWATMGPDLLEIFGHCAGFAQPATAATFYDYIKRCQVETTMPFNDYWLDGLPVAPTKLPIGALAVAAGAAALALVAWVVSLFLNGVLAASGAHGGFARGVAAMAAWGAIVVPVLILVALLALYGLYRWLVTRAARPFPTAPGSDLPTVLKSLFLQQRFTRFAIEAQGLPDAALHQAFGAFLASAQPALPEPTQLAGEVRS